MIKNTKFWSRLCFALAVLVVAYLIVPRVSSYYITTVLNGALIYFVACLGVSIILGTAGQVSFASITFMGVGAYASVNLSMKAGLPTITAMLLALVVTAALALPIGLVLLRLKGTFFTFGTVALTIIAGSVFVNLRQLTGGPDGIAGVPPFSLGSFVASEPIHNYFIISSIALICALFVWRFRQTNLSRAMCSVRDNEIAAQVMGINVYKTKVIAFMMEALFAGLAGVLLVHNNHFVGSSAFVLDQASTFLIMVMLGGVLSTPGVFVGALLITMLPEWLKPLQSYIRLFYGLGVMLLMVFMPMGIAGMFTSFWKKLAHKFHWERKTPVGLGAALPPAAERPAEKEVLADGKPAAVEEGQ